MDNSASVSRRKDILLILNLVALICIGSVILAYFPYLVSALYNIVQNGIKAPNVQWDMAALIPLILQFVSIPPFLCTGAMLVVNICKKQRKLFIVLDSVAIGLLLISMFFVDLCLYA